MRQAGDPRGGGAVRARAPAQAPGRRPRERAPARRGPGRAPGARARGAARDQHRDLPLPERRAAAPAPARARRLDRARLERHPARGDPPRREPRRHRRRAAPRSARKPVDREERPALRVHPVRPVLHGARRVRARVPEPGRGARAGRRARSSRCASSAAATPSRTSTATRSSASTTRPACSSSAARTAARSTARGRPSAARSRSGATWCADGRWTEDARALCEGIGRGPDPPARGRRGAHARDGARGRGLNVRWARGHPTHAPAILRSPCPAPTPGARSRTISAIPLACARSFRPSGSSCRTRRCALAGPVKGWRVLEIGCGAGALAQKLAAEGARVVAIDASPAAVHAADHEAKEAGVLPQPEFAVADLLDAGVAAARPLRPRHLRARAARERGPGRRAAVASRSCSTRAGAWSWRSSTPGGPVREAE